MGFFSDLVADLKGAVQSLINSLAETLNGIFGSPKVAALFFFVVAVVLVVTAPWYAAFLNSPTSFFSLCPSMLTGFVIGSILSVIIAYIPSLAYEMGYIIGVMLFCLVLVGAMGWSAPLMQTMIGWGATQAGLTAAFLIIGTATAVVLATGLSAGPNSDFVEGLIDGFFAVPEAVAEGLDNVAGSLLPWLIAGVAAIVVLKREGGQHAKVQ